MYSVQFYGLRPFTSFNYSLRRCVTYNKIIFACKGHQNHHINWKYNQKNAKTSLKIACSRISDDRNSIEFHFWAKSSLENNLLPPIPQVMKADTWSMKWIVQVLKNRET